ncbi:MAG: cell division protein FtsA [Patescibacteria group bacterium]|nr:cell division protein FtsA [Patescibacteria group bacterium]
MAKGRIITGLDLGTATIKILVGLWRKSKEVEVLAQSEEPSSGIRRGVVINPSEVANLIRTSFKKIQEKINQKIDSVYVNIGGGHIFSTTSRGLVSVSRADQKISSEDVERVLAASQTLSLPPNREILEVFPKEFIVDGEKGIKEVLGMQGVRLEAEVLILCGFTPYLKNLTQAVLDAGLQIADIVISPLASSRACLTPREKELGVALLDIGAGTTSLAVFEEGDLLHMAILPIGSSHITNDIAIFLKSDIDIAERIKLEFGSCLFQSPQPPKTARGTDKKIRIEMDSGEPLIFSHKQLIEIIEARVSEIFGEINKELKKISRQGLLPAGVVLTGGGAKLPKIVELAKKELRLPCRIGKPQGFSLLQEDPALALVCGLVLKGVDMERESGFSGKGIGAKLKRIFKIFIP